MTAFLNVLMAALAAVTLDNVIFTYAIGTSTLLECAKKPKQLLSFGFFITEFSVLASILVYLAEQFTNNTLWGEQALPVVCILALSVVYIVTLLVIWFAARKWFNELKRYVHLSAFNCASLGCLFMNSINQGTLGERVLFALSIGIGFMLATYLLSINYKKLTSQEVPAAFRGFPASVLYIGIIAMIIYVSKI